MYKRSNTRDDSRFRRPDANPPQDSWEEQPPVYSGRPMDEREEPYPESPYEELPEGFYDEELPPEEPLFPEELLPEELPELPPL